MNAHKHKYADAHTGASKLTRVGIRIYTYFYVYVDAYMRIHWNMRKHTSAQIYIHSQKFNRVLNMVKTKYHKNNCTKD